MKTKHTSNNGPTTARPTHQDTVKKELILAARRNDLNRTNDLLRKNELDLPFLRKILSIAHESHSNQIVKHILTDSKIANKYRMNSKKSFIWAIRHGYSDIVDLYLKTKSVNPVDNNFKALEEAWDHDYPLIAVKLEAWILANGTNEECRKLTHRNIARQQLYDATCDTDNPELILDLIHSYQFGRHVVHQVFICASRAGHLNVVQQLLKNEVLDLENNDTYNLAFRHAAANGHIEIVKALLKINPPENVRQTKKYEAFQLAASNGHLSVVLELLKLYNPSIQYDDDDNCAFRMAAINGHLSVVHALLKLPDINPCANNFQVVIHALNAENWDILEAISEWVRINGTKDQRQRFNDLLKKENNDELDKNTFISTTDHIEETTSTESVLSLFKALMLDLTPPLELDNIEPSPTTIQTYAAASQSPNLSPTNASENVPPETDSRKKLCF